MLTLLLIASLASASPSTGTVTAETAAELERAKAEVQEAFDYLRVHAPMAQKMLDYLRAESPSDFRRKLRQLVDLSDDPQLRERLTAALKLEAAAREKALALEKAEEKDRPALRKELEKLVGQLFDAKMETQEILAKKLDKEAADIRKGVSQRRAKKAELVKKRVAQLTGAPDELDW